MEDKEWLCFEKSGRVSDYLAYCHSGVGKFTEYETADSRRCEKEDGADMYPDGNDTEFRSGGRVR